MEFAAAKWTQSTRLWQAISLVFGVLFIWERFDLGDRLPLGHPLLTGRGEGAVSSANAAARILCDCPWTNVLNSTSLPHAREQPLLVAPIEKPALAHRGVVEPEALGRMLGGDNSSSNNSNHSAHSAHGAAHGDHGAHQAHPHVALFYLFIAILIGTVVLHLMTLPMFHGLQQTVVLFILGLIFSAIFEGLHVKDEIIGASHDMWMQIDPHLLLYTMLPALLTGDAITIDTSIARKVAQQCIYLAGPGVLLGAFGIAGFLHLYFQWDFLLCLCTGSILSATDPVAVVGLLKELGASPTLTVQIQGESLLNDGTAIVLYLLAYNSIMGVPYDAGDIIIFLVKMAMSAIALGCVIGYFFLVWIRLACKRLEHHAGLIQTTLTICCAYSSFCIAEGALGISGVLCTVSSSLVLADKMWPSIVEKEGLHQVWHMLEYLGNTIIFFLAGGLTGKVLVTIQWRDLLDLLLLYVVCTIVRGLILFGSRPILRHLNEAGQPISRQDATIMTWGGLRGAVGLALAVQVNIGRIDNNISADQANKVLFFVAGMACLTLLINATTSPALVRMLGVTRTPKAKQLMLFKIHAQMKCLESHKDNPKVVQTAIEELMQEAYAQIDKLVKDKKLLRTNSFGLLASAIHEKAPVKVFKKVKKVIPSLHVNALLEAKKMLLEIRHRRMKLLQVPKLKGDAYDEMMCQTAKDEKEGFEAVMVHTMNEALLYLVRSEYWHLIESGEFVDGSSDSELLLHSVRLGIDQADTGQSDLAWLVKKLHLAHQKALRPSAASEAGQNTRTSVASKQSNIRTSITSEPEHDRESIVGRARNTLIGRALLVDIEAEKTPLMKFTESIPFNAFMGVMIALNVVYIIIEQTTVWNNAGATLAFEIFFVSIFTLEFLLKLVAYRCSYFVEAWNVFDFALVIIGLVGLVFLGMLQEVPEGGSEQDMSQEARMFRINRVFRVLRIIRVFRLLNFARLLYAKMIKKEFSLQLAEHLQAITVLKAFVKAHMLAQEKLLRYFGRDGKPQSPEVAIAIVQSQTQVYKALHMAGRELDFVDPSIIRNVNIQRKVFVAAQDLSNFVLQAHHDGVITARMAETILHPVRDHMRVIDRMLSEVQSGMRGRGAVKLTHGSVGTDGGQHEEQHHHTLDDGFYDSEDDRGSLDSEEEHAEKQMAEDASPMKPIEVPTMPVRLGQGHGRREDAGTAAPEPDTKEF